MTDSSYKNGMQVSEKQERWIKQLEELWNFFDARLKGYRLKTNDLRFGLLLNIAVAAHRLIRGFLAQLRGGSNDFLESRLRTLIEATITINYILADETGNRARAYFLDGTRSRLTEVTRTLRFLEQKQALSPTEVKQIASYNELKLSLEQKLSEGRERLGKNATWPNIEQRAKGGNSEGLYVGIFWLFSQDTHMTVEGLNRYLSNREGSIAMTTELDLSLLDKEIQTAYISYLALINTCSEKLGFPSQKELQAFNNSEMLPKLH